MARVSRRIQLLGYSLLASMLLFVYLSHSVLMELEEAVHPMVAKPASRQRKGGKPAPYKLLPAGSAPRSIPLGSLSQDYLLHRHECIADIRKRHVETLQPLVTGKSVLLVDPAYHENVGDHMITLGELNFLGASVDQCNYVQAGPGFPPCDETISAKYDVAVWHGGGNWGDIWPTAQEARTRSFSKLLGANNKIVSMPQSLYFRSPDKEKSNTAEIANAVHEHLDEEASDRIFLTWRERESLAKARKLYPFATNLLLPDIAFQLGPFAQPTPSESDPPTVDVLFLLRRDRESRYSQERSRSHIRSLLPDDLTFSIVDWEDRLERFDSTDTLFTTTSIRLLWGGRVLICDRLHAAILAYLAGVPFVYVDPETGKITKTFSVAMTGECANGAAGRWARATDLPDAIAQAVKFLDDYDLRPKRKRQRVS